MKTILQINTLARAAELGGRTLLAAIFLASGLGKLGAWTATQQYMASQGVPGALLAPVVALEIGGAALVIAGLWTRLAAVALAAFTALAAVLFHANLGDPVQQIMFLKNFAIAGGFLVLATHGAGAWSVDARIGAWPRRGAPQGASS